MKRVEITVSPKGETIVKTKGFTGSECVNASKFIELALGKSSSQIKTAEFYSSTSNEVNLNNSAGS